jgi:predicted NUDIX family NTP pyrophosphohydrolase
MILNFELQFSGNFIIKYNRHQDVHILFLSKIMTKKSAGILLYRRKTNAAAFFLVHPGGPFWKNKDIGAWSIPKGEFTDEEDPLDAAKRELEEEIGIKCNGPFLELTAIKQKGGKLVYAWATEKDFDPGKLKSNTFQMEWPPKSGKLNNFPEIDRGQWFFADEAKQKINLFQSPFIDELVVKLNLGL